MDSIEGIFGSSSYLDLRSCTEICRYCGANFWFGERLKSIPISAEPVYTGCCKQGKVVLGLLPEPLQLLRDLIDIPHFMQNIRAYNIAFSMTSFGAKVDDSINRGSSPYVFKVVGQVSHWVGSLCPEVGEKPRFLQMYIYDSENEVSNRLRFFSSVDGGGLRESIVVSLLAILNSENRFVRLFRTARDMCLNDDIPDFSIRLFTRTDDNRYGIPTGGSIGAIISGGELSSHKFDVIIRNKNGTPHRISRLHVSYMPLQYPLLFPRGELGWSPQLRLVSDDGSNDKNLTASMYYSHQFHERDGVYSHLMKAGRLFQQYVVDAYVCIEKCRLDFIRSNQQTFRSEYLSGVHDAIARGDVEGRSIGKRIILPSSFTGGPQYMYKHYQDALELCRVFGNPQYFKTFTCNASWPEIRRELDRVNCANANDRPDIVVRVFELKVKDFIDHLKSTKPFGPIEAELYTIEFQKRGLPHCHTFIWVSKDYKINKSEDVDRYISAEIPDQQQNPESFQIVVDCMIHGSCGVVNLKCSCMKEGMCSKKFPKCYEDRTYFDDEGYVHYKRSMSIHSFNENGYPFDNRFVVPYNTNLLLHFSTHINVEYCGWSMLIKYLFKYIFKGVDRIRFAVVPNEESSHSNSTSDHVIVDEISNFVDGRYLCPYEAAWRIFGFNIHPRNPAVQVLAVHLDGMQNITFRDNQHLAELAENENRGKTTLTQWLVNNRCELFKEAAENDSGINLKYVEYLSKYRWDQSSKSWLRRKTKRMATVGRMAYVHPSCGELFYLRLLLCHQAGCCTFGDIRTISGTIYPTFRAACERLGLIGNDSEWPATLNEVAQWASAAELHTLFAHILLFCDVANPSKLWQDHWFKFGDDFRHHINSMGINSNFVVNDHELQKHILLDLEQILNSSSTSRSLADFSLLMPDLSAISTLSNRLILEEKSYNRSRLSAEHRDLLALLNTGQLSIYNDVLHNINSKKQSLLLIYGHGGTGKTFVWKTIIAALRSQGQIVLSVATSGIASLLLPSGWTAHSRFKLPMTLTDDSVCYIKKNTHFSQLLIETSFIIWDEAPMSDR